MERSYGHFDARVEKREEDFIRDAAVCESIPGPFNRIIERLSKTHEHINSIASQLGDNADRMFGPNPRATTDEKIQCASSCGGLTGEIEEWVLRINAALDWLECEAKRNCEA